MKKEIIELIVIMLFLGTILLSCNTNKQNKNDYNNTINLSDEYHANKITLQAELDNIEDCSIINDERILLITGNNTDTPYNAFISNYSLDSFTKVNFENLPNDTDNIQIKGSGDGNIVICCSENIESSNNSSQTKKYRLFETDDKGNIISENLIDFGNYSKDIDYLSDMTIWGDSIIFKILRNSQTCFLVTDRMGKFTGSLEYKPSISMQYLCTLNDNELAVLGRKGINNILSFYNSGNITTDNIVILDKLININTYSVIKGYGDIKYYITSDNAVYGFDKESQIIKTINLSDVDDYIIKTIIPQKNDEYIIIGNHSSENNKSTVYHLTKYTDSEIENIKILTIAALNSNTELSDMVNEYNNTHSSVRIKIIDYNDNSDNGELELNGIENLQFKQDLISGNTPDMFFSNNRSDNVLLANKGLLADLYYFLDNDNELSRESILDNILKACEVKGNLSSFSPSFTVSTMAAKKKWINKENWTINDAVSAYYSMPEDMRYLVSESREELTEMLFHIIADYIDLENGKCDFKNDDFRNFMNLADSFYFADNNNLNSNNLTDNNSFSDYANDKTLLSFMYLYDFRNYLTDKAYLWGKEDICFTGFPSHNKNGADLNFSINFSIFENSENKEACWDFIKSTFKEQELDDLLNLGAFPSLKTNFYKLADDITKIPVYKNENGDIEEQPLTISVNEKVIELSPFTEAEKNTYVSYITSVYCDKTDLPSQIVQIISEEISLWINGSESSDAFIDSIQNRVSIIMNELN